MDRCQELPLLPGCHCFFIDLRETRLAVSGGIYALLRLCPSGLMETIVRRAEFCSDRLEWVADSSRPDDYPSIVSNPGEVAVLGLVYAAEVNISQR
jgi:hypothetical protein